MGQMQTADDIEFYQAEPADGTAARGTVILIHEIWGLVDHITDVADRLAAEGYLVVAPDLLSAVGITPEVGAELNALSKNPDEEARVAAQPRLREAMAPARSPEFAEQAIARLRAVVDRVEPRSSGRIAVMGFCFGGTYSFALAAADARIRAAVPFYGSAPDAEGIARIDCPILALYGEDDPAIVERLPEVRQHMADAGVDFEHHVYAGARHAFFNDTNPRSYDPEVAADAWSRTLEFLGRTLS